MTIPEELTTLEQVREFIHTTISRRTFNKSLGIAGLGAIAFQYGCSSSTQNVAPRPIFVANADGLVVADNTLCVGCRRCESACVAFNQGNQAPGNNPANPTGADAAASTMAQPAISNIKINRNLLYGVNGAKDMTGQGLYGNFTVVQNTCLQCPHPVPCQLACPHGAIQVVGPVNARVVNTDLCQGCGVCVKACPWQMPSLDGEPLAKGTKAHKCHLCGGAPECVAACTTGALQYLPWTDQTSYTPVRQTVPASIQMPPDVAATCSKCH
ncbi:4Fe-4S dicluster domain-containing protein [Anaeromyxobacter paludicola]|uniref:4Fe-4S dicluster domain-containing protein n=1 Tax=Anaeromyxobacter paludicola TaxID=2918171 RepID=UPI0020BE464B|nr:4Fe-4S dicluster domain-containing protein [Anaeromyxobacter paludicola]